MTVHESDSIEMYTIVLALQPIKVICTTNTKTYIYLSSDPYQTEVRRRQNLRADLFRQNICFEFLASVQTPNGKAYSDQVNFLFAQFLLYKLHYIL